MDIYNPEEDPVQNSKSMISRDVVVNRITDGELVMVETAEEFAFVGIVLKNRQIPYHVVRVSQTQLAFHHGSQLCEGYCE